MVRDIDKGILLYTLRNYVKKLNYPLSYRDDNKFYNRNSNFNCYAYALGLKVLDKFDFLIDDDLSIYNPGTISSLNDGSYDEKKLILYNEKSLIKAFKDDCDVLGIEYKSTYIDSDMEEDSSKIGIYISSDRECLVRDFHFVRQNSDGVWSNMQYSGGPVFELGKDNIEYIPNYDFLGAYTLRKKR